MQGLKDFDPSQNMWIQMWLSRLGAETRLLNFLGPLDVNECGQSLTSLSVEDPERFREFSVGLLPRILKALLNNDPDDSSWALLFDEVGSLFPEFKNINRSHMLWLIRQIQASNELVTKLRSMIESGDVNIEQGMENWRCDILAEAMLPDTIRPDIFCLGQNIAATSGHVVFENQLFQLLQYHPATETVYENPVLLIPAFVNRFYILDLSDECSMVKWLVDQGHTVFLISWVNPTELLATYEMTHYVLDGALAALDCICRMLPGCKPQVVGYCAGGVVSAILAAWLKACGEDRISSLSLLATLLDYKESGPLGNLVSEESIESFRKPLNDLGYLPAELLLRIFAGLRPHDLIFERMLNSYILGQRAKPNPLLHWLGDGTRTPSSLVLWILEKLYFENVLVKETPFELAGQRIQLSIIDCPVFLFGAERDDISPWQSVMHAADQFGSTPLCVLGEGGHNGGVVNHPSKPRYNHFALNNDNLTNKQLAEFRSGSWWRTWHDFLTDRVGEPVLPPKTGGGIRAAIERAPGRYVRIR